MPMRTRATSEKPAASAHARRRRPASASAPLLRVTSWYSASQRVERGDLRIPRHRRVVGVARGHDTIGLADAAHLAQRGDRVGEVLEHLMRVHDVERRVREVERVHVAGLEGHVRNVGCALSRLRDDVGFVVEPGDMAG